MPFPVLKTLRMACIPRPGCAQMRRIFGSVSASTRAGNGLHCHSGGRLAAAAGIAGLRRRLGLGLSPVLSHLRGAWSLKASHRGPMARRTPWERCRQGAFPVSPHPCSRGFAGMSCIPARWFPKTLRRVPNPLTR